MSFDSGLLMEIFLLIILVGINAFFAASEIAIISVNDKKIKRMADEGNKKAKLLYNLIKEPSKFFATIQVGVTLSGLLASAFAAESFADRLAHLIKATGIPVEESVIKLVSIALITVLLAYFTLVFGELIPKRVGMQKAEEIAMIAIRPLSWLLKIAKPFVGLLTFSMNFIIKLFGGNPNANEETVTEEEILMMVDLGEEKGVIHESEREMIENIFGFNDTPVQRVMTHRKDITAISVNSPMSEVLSLVAGEKYTRVPVFEDTIDKVVGILHIKDLLHFIQNGDNKAFSLKEIIRPPYFVPFATKTDKLFKKMQKSKVQMAVVLDEYGGTEGIVTIEDLLEEIVGNIYDEYDDEVREFEQLDKNTYIMNGIIGIDKVQEILNTKLPIGEYDTLGGFIIGQLARIPGEDEKPKVEYEDLIFKVEKVKGNRIEKVKVCKA